MEIVNAIPADLVEIMYLLRVCVKDMNEKGMKQWNSVHPDAAIIKRNLSNGFIYLIKDKGVCKGMVTLTAEQPEDHIGLNSGSNGKRVLYLQWMAVHPFWQGTGISRILLEYAEDFARKNSYDTMQLDIFSNHELTEVISKNNDFTELGKFHSSFQKTPFICYEKVLK